MGGIATSGKVGSDWNTRGLESPRGWGRGVSGRDPYGIGPLAMSLTAHLVICSFVRHTSACVPVGQPCSWSLGPAVVGLMTHLPLFSSRERDCHPVTSVTQSDSREGLEGAAARVRGPQLSSRQIQPHTRERVS